MKNIIHQTAEERLAGNSQSTIDRLDAIQEELRQMRTDKGAVNKLDEVKSAHLITNRLLKSMQPESNVRSVEYFTHAIRGDQGPKGDKGDKGDRGEKGDAIKGSPGPQGLRGLNGDTIKGPKGDKGDAGPQGEPGIPGVPGSPDTPDEVIAKVNAATNKIDPKQVRGLTDILSTVDQIGKNPQGQNVGGANPLIFRNSGGTRISDYVTDVKLSTGLTGTYSNNGLLTVTASGSGYTELTATGTVDGNNKIFTFIQTPTYVVSDGTWYKSTDNNGATNWSGTTTVTMTIPPTSAIWGFV